MSQPSLHVELAKLYELKTASQLELCLKHPDYQKFQKSLDLDIPHLQFVKAFTHASFEHEFKVPHQEQLEFLGDSVLQLLITEELYRRYPEIKEGTLSKVRSSIVNEEALAALARNLNLGTLLLMGRGEFKKQSFDQNSVLADTFEALLGVIYLFYGLPKVSEIFFKTLNLVNPLAFDLDGSKDFDSKSKLQELTLAKYKTLPKYIAKEVQEKFEIELWINNEFKMKGIFSSKKLGEKELAKQMIMKGLI